MRAAALVVGALLALAPLSDASAQQHLSAQDEANARFQTGLKYYDARDFESARLAFTQAYAVLQKPGILLNLALSELYSNHVLEAIPHFEQYMKDPSTTSDRRDAAKKHLDEALKKTGHLQIRTAAEADVKLDGRPLPPPYTSLVHVLPGSHSVEARLGDKTKQATVDAKPGDTVAVDLVFENAPPTPPPDPIATSPSSPTPTASPPPSPPTEPTERETFWGLRSVGGLIVAGVGAGVLVFGIVRKNDEASASKHVDDLKAQLPRDACFGGSTTPACGDLASSIDERDSAKSQGNAALVIGIAAVVVGTAAVVSAVLVPHKRAAGRVVPSVGPGYAGLVLSNSFSSF